MSARPAPPAAARTRRQEAPAGRFFVPVALLLLFLLWTLVAYCAFLSRQAAIENTEQVLRRTNHAAEEQTRRLFRTVEDFFVLADRWLAEDPRPDAWREAAFLRLVETFRQRTGDNVDVHLAADDGTLTSLGAPLPVFARMLGDEDFFRAAIVGDVRHLHIGVPQTSGPNGEWQIPVAHRLSRQSAAGAAFVATIRLPALLPQYEELRLRPNGAVGLLRRDGMLLARAPHDDRLMAQSLAGGQLYREFLPRAERGFGKLTRTATDAMEKFVGYSILGDLPLVVVSSAKTDEALAAWRQRMAIVGLFAAVLSAVVLLAALRAARTLNRLSARNAELESLTTTDMITGVCNRHHFLSLFQHEFVRARRHGSPLSLLVLDLDFFKQINDGYGHAVGDEALRAFARASGGCLREMDVIGRLGGEEFAVLLPNAEIDQAQAVAERIRAAVDRISIDSEFGTVRFTTSIGVTRNADQDASIDVLLTRADAALYTAKAAGRNRVIIRLAGDRHSRF